MSRVLVRWWFRSVCAALVFAAVAFVPAASAADGGPKLLAPAQAQALIGAPGAQTTSVTHAVSPQEALSAASLPGAAVSVAPGLSLLQAVGLSPVTSPSTGSSALARPAVADTPTCAANEVQTSWSTWPYDLHLSDTTYWCMVYGDHITYHSSTVNATSTFCGTSWTTSQQISGGIGYSWFVMRSSAGWSCPTTFPWITFHPSHHEDVSRNDWGSTAVVETG
jgi:hypothetical protein